MLEANTYTAVSTSVTFFRDAPKTSMQEAVRVSRTETLEVRAAKVAVRKNSRAMTLAYQMKRKPSMMPLLVRRP